MSPIHTLNSRSNVLLEVARDHYGITGVVMQKSIQHMHRELIEILQRKGVDYGSLRTALVPSTDKKEAAFLFNPDLIEGDLYGNTVFEKFTPLLSTKTCNSILVGETSFGALKSVCCSINEQIILARPCEIEPASWMYIIYINNLSPELLTNIHTRLSNIPGYTGCIDTTFFSAAKACLSTCLSGFIMKAHKTFIVAHEDDRPNSENVNITTYHFENSEYRIASIQSMFFSLFLTYKIERPVWTKSEESDNQLALNSVSSDPHCIQDFDIQIEEAKHQKYLLVEKIGSLTKAGFAELSRSALEDQIRIRLSQSYIYNLQHLEEHNTIKFNVMIEVTRAGYPARLTVALEYLHQTKTLRLITMY